MEIIETCQEFSNWRSKLLYRLVPCCVFQMLQGAKKSFHQVSLYGSLGGDHWNLSGILQLMFKASPQSRALSCLSNAPLGKKVFSSSETPWRFARLSLLILFRHWLCFSRKNLGSSMHNGYSRTCCFMRWNSSYSTAEGCKYCLSLAEIIFVRNPPLIFKASAQSRVALKHSKGQRSVFIKWAPWQFRQCYIVFCFRLSHFFLRW